MMNKIDRLFQNKKSNILSIFFTAGYPRFESTVEIIKSLEESGVDMIEVGIPYSDPLADGPVIQNSSTISIRNGMNMDNLFDQLMGIKNSIRIPIILMGYLNPILQFGVERFCERSASCGVSGVIIPDLPMEEFYKFYSNFFESNNLNFIFLVTPNTSDDRVRTIDHLSKGFIYAVSSSSTTGSEKGFENDQVNYLKRLKDMNLKNPVLVGFGIHSKETLRAACDYANGAIIGSAYIKVITGCDNLKETTKEFIENLVN